MRKRVLCLAACFCLALSGCSVATPKGTLHLSYSAEEKSDTTKIVMANGEEFVFKGSTIKESLDKMLDSLHVDGVDTNELKDFVYTNLSALGIDVENMELSLDGLAELEASVQDSLTQKGVDAIVDMEATLEEE